MTTVTLKGFVHYCKGLDGPILFANDMSAYGYPLIGPVEFEYALPPDFHPVSAQVAALKQERDRLEAEHGRQLAAIEDKLAKLLCLENNPTPQAQA